MGKQTTSGRQTSSVVWDNLKEWVRRNVQDSSSLFLKKITELLGRRRSERRKLVYSLPIYLSGYGKGRKLTATYISQTRIVSGGKPNYGCNIFGRSGKGIAIKLYKEPKLERPVIIRGWPINRSRVNGCRIGTTSDVKGTHK
jgi:hypothetical protein